GAYIGIQVGNTSNSNETQEEQIEEESSLPDTGHIPAEQMQKFEMAYELINQHYLEDMESDVLIEGAIEGMLESLDDPFSSYMDKEMMSEFNEQIEASFEGIGAEVSLEDDIVTIISPIKGSPAEQTGLRPKDQILKID